MAAHPAGISMTRENSFYTTDTWIGSEMLVATGWPWLKSSIRTGAKQMDKFCEFILFRADWAVTRDRWSMVASKQF